MSDRILHSSFRWPLLLAVVTLFAVLVAACDWDEGGFPKVTQRDPGPPPVAEFPQPPRAGADALAMDVVDFGAIDFPVGVTADMAEMGEGVYARVCVACHAAGGAGSTIGPALNDDDWIHIDGTFEQIVSITRAGVAQPQVYPAAMPPMGGASLDDEQLQAVSAYVYALSRLN